MVHELTGRDRQLWVDDRALDISFRLGSDPTQVAGHGNMPDLERLTHEAGHWYWADKEQVVLPDQLTTKVGESLLKHSMPEVSEEYAIAFSRRVYEALHVEDQFEWELIKLIVRDQGVDLDRVRAHVNSYNIENMADRFIREYFPELGDA